MGWLQKVFGTKNERELKQIGPLVTQINELEPSISALSDQDIAAMTPILKQRLEKGEPLDSLLPEAFAVVREASVRTLKMRHFDAQLIGGVVLHQGKIAEMKTGEGKTLAATLPVYLNALTGRGVHVVTVNDYLARRDTQWMGAIYHFLGLTTGTVLHGLNDQERKQAYGADVTYGTNNEFGFDYLRDNMKYNADSFVQRGHFFAIVDEVDSILIDEARTPLIISGSTSQTTQLYYQVDVIIPRIKKEDDYATDEKSRTVNLTEQGVAKVENMLGVENLFDHSNIEMLHHVNQALKAHVLFKRDVDYIVKDGEVVIVDEFTGRLMPGRRYGEGLHQALEAKEKVKIENENQTLASITFQNYFRMYEKLAGMTGTADTEALEFKKIYNLDVTVVPTHQPMIRIDYPDAVFMSKKEKFDAVIMEIEQLHQKGQPVLVGTISIDISEMLAKKLAKKGVPHNVLNAKNHAGEAEIVANAGQRGSVTISTNMAGRGTDIVLGEGVVELGGLHILGTERHESRRIDNQLRGRSGRQGDPGSSRFHLSLEDDLLRIFGGERISGLMDKVGMEDGEAIESRFISKRIEDAQRQVEGHNFHIRKQLLEYDDVMNQQREVIYRQRRDILTEESLEPAIVEMIEDCAFAVADNFANERVLPEEWDLAGLSDACFVQLCFRLELGGEILENLTPDGLGQIIYEDAISHYKEKEAQIGPENMRQLERFIMLQVVDSLWMDHLLSMDHLKEGIGLRGYAQQNPLIVYKKEGFELFENLITKIKHDTISLLFRAQLAPAQGVPDLEKAAPRQMTFSHGGPAKKTPVIRTTEKVGRNDPCPCGSGKKYKKCCGT